MNRRFCIITLGCPKNTVDSENMTAVLKSAGFTETSEPAEAGVIIVNTCCFIEPAQEEAIDVIFEAARLKQQTGAFLMVTGCMAQRYKDQLADEMPEVDSWMGLEDLASIGDVAEKTLLGKKVRLYENPPPDKFEDLPRVYSTPAHYGYLKIAEGCSHRCSFCVIPQIRGPYRSIPREAALREAKKMLKSGRKEIILIAQDTTLYGTDLYGKRVLAPLLQDLASLEGLEWLRLMYAYPSSLTDDVLKVMGENPKICKYVDIPLQHSHPDVLRKMGRPADVLNVESLIERIRTFMPDGVIRTAFIVGHPGETESRFMHLADFIRRHRFYHVGVFEYSPQEGTSSANMKKAPSRKEAARRRDYLMALQQEIALDVRQKMVGRILPAVCEGVLSKEEDKERVLVDYQNGQTPMTDDIPPGATAFGRTVLDAPDIDGLLYIKGDPPPAGSFFKVKIQEAFPYDLAGVVHCV